MTEDLEFGLFAVDQDSRIVRGIIVPWGEASAVSSTGNAPLTFRPEDIRVPRDHSVVVLNRHHDRYDPIGRGVKFDSSHERGLYAEYRIAETEEGDAWLADHGSLVRLSPELRDITRHADGHATATLTGSALVEAGAFASAGLFAIGDVVDAPAPEADPAHIVLDAEAAPEDITVRTPEGSTVYTPDDETPSEETNEEGEFAMSNSLVPDGVQTPEAPKADLSARGLFAAVHKAHTEGDTSALVPFHKASQEAGLFALSDVKFNGTGGLNNNDQLTGPRYLGELWAGRRFDRTVVPLLTQDTLTSLNATGWVWNAKPTMATWAGNKAAVPSNTPTVTPTSYAAQRFAGGHDLAREFYDFNQTDVIESYVRAMVDSYATLSDAYALTQLVAGATAVTLGAVTGTQSKAVNAIIDLATAVANNRATPSYALVGASVYRDIFTTQQTGSYAYVSGEAEINVGRIAGIPVYFDGRLAAGQVVVGSKEAATAWELAGSPIRVQANDLVNGGIDNAFFGYIAVGVTFPGAVAKATITYA
ncbi:hypothetical protein DBR36_01535 [Microbacterium sp. HMWF026]|uniref:hypothetical protein n=1 Tax=Microbacterium sp. HMWF026 TaxID=2056861 RepID=UPI000D33AFCB|nr:hypothetical protein [Microbacterium sp. HMWF026]PTT22617.1 hypothetical protein DBR36_01535 [Microbacterium sp. HMWF026]